MTDVTGLSPSLAPGSGGIVSTVRDVADFYRALLSGRLLAPAQMRAMKTTVSERTGKLVAPAGTGPRHRPAGTHVWGWGHSGELPGLRRADRLQRGRPTPSRADDQPERDHASEARAPALFQIARQGLLRLVVAAGNAMRP